MMKIFLLKLGFFLSGLIWGVYALAAQPLQNKHLSGGLVHSLYIDSTGNVWVWGGSSLDGVSNELIPSIAMKEGRSAHSNFDSNTTFVIKQDGSLWGWGNTIAGQLRLFPKDDRMNSAFIDIPREILSHAIAVNGDGSIFAIKPDHSLWVWGHWGSTAWRCWTQGYPYSPQSHERRGSGQFNQLSHARPPERRHVMGMG